MTLRLKNQLTANTRDIRSSIPLHLATIYSARTSSITSMTARESEIAMPWDLASDILRKTTSYFALASPCKQLGYSGEYVLILSFSNIHVVCIQTPENFYTPMQPQKLVDIG